MSNSSSLASVSSRIVLSGAVTLLALLVPSKVSAEEVVVAAAAPVTGNCFPFGAGTGVSWAPYMGWVYAGLPPFLLMPGDQIAFDTMLPNDVSITLSLALAKTISDGGTEPDEDGFTVIVASQTPADPDGDDVQGNYELAFTVEEKFFFPGGGLVIRVAPDASYTDSACEYNLVGAESIDATGNFVARFLRDNDGVYPWAEFQDNIDIAVFKVTATDDDDHDGEGNSVDNCPDDANADQADEDGDGIGDACDACLGDTTNDEDGDGVCGMVDNCPADINPLQDDEDGDGVGDGCDPCLDDIVNDDDGDGICGEVDNCPDDANMNQADTDEDGLGNVCDKCPDLPIPAEEDDDGDGVGNLCDNCPFVANPDQADADGDDAGNACDPDFEDDSGGTDSGSDAGSGSDDDSGSDDGSGSDDASGSDDTDGTQSGEETSSDGPGGETGDEDGTGGDESDAGEDDGGNDDSDEGETDDGSANDSGGNKKGCSTQGHEPGGAGLVLLGLLGLGRRRRR